MRFTTTNRLFTAGYLMVLSLVSCSTDNWKATKEHGTRETTAKSTSQPARDSLMLESEFGAFNKGPVPAVQVDDLRRAWSFLNEKTRDSLVKEERSASIKLLADQCSPNANVPAVFVRAGLIDALLQQGRLDRWREGNGLVEKVFEVAATFGLPRGLESVDLDALVTAMN